MSSHAQKYNFELEHLPNGRFTHFEVTTVFYLPFTLLGPSSSGGSIHDSQRCSKLVYACIHVLSCLEQVWMGHLGDTPTLKWFYLPFYLVWALALQGKALLLSKGVPRLSMHVCTSSRA